jgi:ABC-type spermidine/putrescine transport system permease subunit II
LEPEYPAFENPLFVPALQVPVGIAIPASALILVLGLLTGAGSLVGRFRRARGVERQQLRWLAFGSALATVALLVALVALQTPTGGDVFQLAVGVCLALLPLATGAAVLRYRLYDIDRIVSRTVA